MWNKPKNKMPERDQKYKNLSVKVIAVTDKGDHFKAFVYLPDDTWYDSDKVIKILDDVIRWKYIEEE